jgi:hypothetical protein
MNNSPKSDSVNKALVHNIKFMLKNETSNGTLKYYPPYKIMITVEVYIMFINNKNNWMTTYFVGMTV